MYKTIYLTRIVFQHHKTNKKQFYFLPFELSKSSIAIFTYSAPAFTTYSGSTIGLVPMNLSISSKYENLDLPYPDVLLCIFVFIYWTLRNLTLVLHASKFLIYPCSFILYEFCSYTCRFLCVPDNLASIASFAQHCIRQKVSIEDQVFSLCSTFSDMLDLSAHTHILTSRPPWRHYFANEIFADNNISKNLKEVMKIYF